MSRIGRLPVKITDGAKVTVNDNLVTVEGKLGTLSQVIEVSGINVHVENEEVIVARTNEKKETKSAHGLYRALIANMVEGVTKGYQKNLMIAGVGYKANMDGKTLVLSVGYSHLVRVDAPEGIEFGVVAPTEIFVKGIDKTLVGQISANIRAIRKPEPYHGYGIRYKTETIIRKEGKKAGK